MSDFLDFFMQELKLEDGLESRQHVGVLRGVYEPPVSA
jgi:hypothetical protein